MARRANRIRPLPRVVPWAVAGAAACLISVGGFQLWQAAAIERQAVAAQQSAAAVWFADPGGAVAPADGPASIARLTSDIGGIDLYVQPRADWDSLLDGPGLFAGVPPGTPGLSVIAGHRETHFAFLRDLAVGDRFTVEDSDGRSTNFRVTEARVVDGRTMRVGGAPAAADTPAEVMLVTCYPFDATEVGPERYVVTARSDT